MAERTPVTEDRIQSLVRGIVGELFNSTSNGNNQGGQGHQFSSVQDEIDQRFRLPRTAVDSAVKTRDDINVDTTTPSTSGNRIQSSIHTTQPTNPASKSRQQPFNALINYGTLQEGRSCPGPTRQRGQNRARNSCLYPRRRQGTTLPIEATISPLLTGTNYF